MNPEKKAKKETIRTEVLLKQTSANYIRLIGNADRKARIMLVVNSILLTLGITVITKIVIPVPYAWTSALLLIIGNLLSLFFTILSVRPEINAGELKAGDNILHYSKCLEYPFSQYREMITTTMHDNDKKMEAMIKEIYFYGHLLSMKYRLMKVAYKFFYWGMAISVVSYFIIRLVSNEHY
jgi:hypothetical protein